MDWVARPRDRVVAPRVVRVPWPLSVYGLDDSSQSLAGKITITISPFFVTDVSMIDIVHFFDGEEIDGNSVHPNR